MHLDAVEHLNESAAAMKNKQYWEQVTEAIEKCVDIFRRHNDSIGPNDSDWKCRYCGRWLPDYKTQCYCGRER